jgi:anti-sigma factor RsiW
MKSDDPRLTAFVLDELTPEEQEQVLRAIETDGFLAAEADELQRFAAGLRAGLQNETADSLTPEQRAAVLGENPAHEESIVIPSVAWWRNPWIPSAAAAVVVAGLATTIYFQAKYIERLTTAAML